MGLDTTHDCWHGPYSRFHRWRQELAKVAGVPLPLMEGFYAKPPTEAVEWLAPRTGGPACRSHLGPWLHGWVQDVEEALPIEWGSLRPDILHVLLSHSDCDGEIASADCGPLADRLETLKPEMDHDWAESTQRFIDGLRDAAAAGENVVFH